MAQKAALDRRHDLGDLPARGVRRPPRSFHPKTFLLGLGLATGALVWLVAAFAGREAAPPGAHDGQSWFVLQRGYPTGRIPSSGSLERAMRGRDPRPIIRTQLNLPGDRWMPIGPQSIFVDRELPYHGRVTAIAPHPTDANTVYVGADGGGIWRTTNGGTSCR